MYTDLIMADIDTKNRPINWRTVETHNRYMRDIEAGCLNEGCALCKSDALHTFAYWKIIDNKYPYDRVAELHHMIIPLRHTDGSDISAEEIEEISMLKKTFLNENYRFILEALPNAKSIPGHLHLHILIPKKV
jgi:hypothetical protein